MTLYDDITRAFVGQWLSSLEMNVVTRVQILDLAVSISHCANLLEISMNSPSGYVQIFEQTMLVDLGIAISLRDNLRIKIPLKNCP